jgi:hypothetical protein
MGIFRTSASERSWALTQDLQGPPAEDAQRQSGGETCAYTKQKTTSGDTKTR